jgi:hypothetical protein
VQAQEERKVMSWNAKRYKYNWHHVPPRNPARTTPVKIRVRKIDHMAYHQLFANAASLEQCIEILKRDWWFIEERKVA